MKLLRRCPLSWFVVPFYFGIILTLTSPVYLTKIKFPELWKNVMIGKYLHYFHQYPHFSTFTTAPVKDFTASQIYDWLGSLILFEVHHVGGSIGLSSLKILPVIVASIVLWILIGRSHPLLFIFSATAIAYGISFRLTPRAALFGLTLYPLLIFSWLKYRVFNIKYHIWFIPILFTIWANLHGSYLMAGFIFSGFLIVPFFSNYIDEGFFSQKNTRLLLVILLLIVGIVFVKPFPHDHLFERIAPVSSYLSNLTMLTEPASRSSLSLPTTLEETKRIIKKLSHDFFLKERPYVSPEFEFTLNVFNGPVDFVAWFLALPSLIIYIIVYQDKIEYSCLTGLFFALWIGISFQRALAYFNLSVLLILPILITKHKTVSTKQVESFSSENFQKITSASIILISLIGFLTLALSGKLRETVGLDYDYWEWGWGLHPSFQSNIPEKLVTDYPDNYRIYNNPWIGSRLLFEVWPYKRVFWWDETTSYRTDFLRRANSKSIRLNTLLENNYHLIVWHTPQIGSLGRKRLNELRKRSSIFHDPFYTVFVLQPEKNIFDRN